MKEIYYCLIFNRLDYIELAYNSKKIRKCVLDLALHIEDIIEKKGSDFELSKLFKAYIKEYKESLGGFFLKVRGKIF